MRARYLVAADGSGSPTRQRLGIDMEGPPPLGDLMNIYFGADLTPWTSHRAGILYWIVNPEVTGVFIALDGQTRWLLNVPYRKEAGETEADYPAERCTALVRPPAASA